jgi:hypothetical protein
MDSHKLVLKFFLDDPSAVAESSFVPVFHSFIQTHALADHLLIDVADYEHVPDGPGTLLVAHEANFYMDHAVGGKLGLLYQRKQPFPGAANFRRRLAAAFAATLRAAARLEDDLAFDGRLKFRTDRAVFRINDRLLAPNTRQTYEEVAPDLRALVLDVYGPAAGDVALEHQPSERRLFEVTMKATKSQDVRALLERVAPLTAG